MSDMTLGDVEITRVEEMHGPIGMTPDVLFPGSPQHGPRPSGGRRSFPNTD